MKRGSANMWWIIIGAIIALVVMIVLMVMFTSKSGSLEGGLLSCDTKGGECMSGENCLSRGGSIAGAFICPGGDDKDDKCCVTTKKTAGQSCKYDSECLSGSCDKVCQEI